MNTRRDPGPPRLGRRAPHRHPELTEAHTVIGDGDLLCQVVARDTVELERVVQALTAAPDVVRTRSQIAFTQRIPPRVLPLVRSARWAPVRRR